jgi:hypothetical protein
MNRRRRSFSKPAHLAHRCTSPVGGPVQPDGSCRIFCQQQQEAKLTPAAG